MSRNEFLPKGRTFSSSSCNEGSTHGEDSLHGSGSSKSSHDATNDVKESNAPGKPAPLPPSKPSSPAPGNDFRYVQDSISSLEILLHANGCSNIPNTYDLELLWSAGQTPPITKKKLSELDVENLYRNLYLRHDQNFDGEILFSPRSPSDAVGKHKKREAKKYWDAVEVELALHMSHLESLRLSTRRPDDGGNVIHEECPSLPAPSVLKVPLRLRCTIEQMSKIITTLVPFSMESSVKTKLDPEMFMQELEHGQSDIGSLFSWLGALLLQSCAPSRDAKINNMIETMSRGSRNQDPRLLRRGLQDLFSILEIMKLDATNYQFQLHRDHMLMHSTQVERQLISMCIKNGWKVSNWLPATAASPNPSLAFFADRLIALITEPADGPLPAALALDYSRISYLRSTFQHLTFHAACTHTLASTLKHLGSTTPPTASSLNTLTTLLTTFEQESPLNPPSPSPDHHESLILSIAHLASSHSTPPPHLPTPSTLSHTRQTLHAALASPASTIATTLTTNLHNAVAAELEEVDALNLSALALANRYASPRRAVSVSASVGVSKAPLIMRSPPLGEGVHPPSSGREDDDAAEQVFDAGRLAGMARRITHVAVLHWRVWAPLLYLRERGE